MTLQISLALHNHPPKLLPSRFPIQHGRLLHFLTSSWMTHFWKTMPTLSSGSRDSHFVGMCPCCLCKPGRQIQIIEPTIVELVGVYLVCRAFFSCRSWFRRVLEGEESLELLMPFDCIVPKSPVAKI